MARRRTRFVLLGIVLLLGAGAGMFALVGNVGMTDEARASEHWPRAPGTMRSSDFVEHSGRGSHYYEVLVTYDYEAAGAALRGNRVGFYKAGNFDHVSDARAFVARYRAGARVDVYYDPDHPDHAVLVPGGLGVGFAAIVMFALMGVALLAGAIACFMRARRA